MLDWVITCHDDRTQEMLDALEKKHGALLQYRIVNFWCGLTSDMLSRMMCDILHKTDFDRGIILLTDIVGVLPYHVAPLLNRKHPRCEVVPGAMLPLIEQTMACRETMTNSVLREHIVELGVSEIGSPWHQQQKNPPFVLKYNLYEY